MRDFNAEYRQMMIEKKKIDYSISKRMNNLSCMVCNHSYMEHLY